MPPICDIAELRTQALRSQQLAMALAIASSWLQRIASRKAGGCLEALVSGRVPAHRFPCNRTADAACGAVARRVLDMRGNAEENEWRNGISDKRRIFNFRRRIRARLAKCTEMRASRAPGSDFEPLLATALDLGSSGFRGFRGIPDNLTFRSSDSTFEACFLVHFSRDV